MDIDIERLKWDAEYWDEVAPDGATHYNAECANPWLKDGPASYWTEYAGWVAYISETNAIAHFSRAIPRPTKPAAPEWDEGGCMTPEYGQKREESRKAPEFGLLVNPRNKALVYGQDSIGEEVEIIEYLPSEKVYVVRFEWGLGCVDCDMIDFRTQAERDREELAELIRETPTDIMFGQFDDAPKDLADAIIAARYRKERES